VHPGNDGERFGQKDSSFLMGTVVMSMRMHPEGKVGIDDKYLFCYRHVKSGNC